MPGKDELLLTWLIDAYGVETALYDQESTYLPNVTGAPEFEARLVQHLDLTTRHLNMLDEHIACLGGTTSSLQNGGLPRVMRLLKGARRSSAQSRVVQDWISTLAAEHFAIATYRALITVAEVAGDEGVVATCRQILGEEEEMAQWLTAHLPAAVQGLGGEHAPGKGAARRAQSISPAGTLEDEHIYAAFEDEAQAQRAEVALARAGVVARRLDGHDAVSCLRGESGGALAAVSRSLKGSMGETQLAERYAHHMEQGRVVLAIPCGDRAQANRVLSVLDGLGARDVSYLSTSGMEYLGV